MLRRFLTDADEELLKTERRHLLALRGPLASLDADADDLALLDRALLQLDELFLLVVVGEFNAGKSAFINALLGQRFLPEGVTPTTTQVVILKHGEATRQEQLPNSAETSEVLTLTYPVEWLREINIVDTPGTNAVIQRHQRITEEFVPRADLVLFVTSADRPFSESERLFLQRIREWGKKVVLVVNKIDILETAADVEHVLAFVETHGRELLGRQPIVFPISARQARQAKETLDANERGRLWAASRFEPLEGYVLETLDERERLRLKLASPLGVAQRLVERYLQTAQSRRSLLHEDVASVRTVVAQLAAYESDMRRDFKYHLSHVDNVLYAMSERGNRFFDETIRLGRIFDLVNADRIRGLFERAVVADTANQVEAHTHEVIDWLVQQDYRQWQAVTEYLNQRVARHEGQMVGRVEGGFSYNRQALLESVGQAARAIVGSYDQEAEARQLAESLQIALAQTAIVEVGAVGLGALLVKLLATTLADVSGVLAVSALAVLGLYLLPNKRRRAKADLAAKVADLRGRLTAALTDEFEAELGKSLQRIREAVRPYTRFVEMQQVALAETETALRNAQRAMGKLAGRIEETLRVLVTP
jgi:small GTP-binding protein